MASKKKFINFLYFVRSLSILPTQAGDSGTFFAQNTTMICVSSSALRIALVAFSVIGIGAALVSTPAAALSDEEWVVAFVRFINWPAPEPDTTLVVCQHPETPALLLDGKLVRGLTTQVRRVSHTRELDSCNAFVAFSGVEASWAPWLKLLNQVTGVSKSRVRPVLTIGKGPQFCELGGAICLVKNATTGSETYRLNLDALARAGFRVDSQLLRSSTAPAAKAEQTMKAPSP